MCLDTLTQTPLARVKGGAGLGTLKLSCPDFVYTPARNYCEISSENIFHVTDMRFSKKIIPKQFVHVIL